MVIDTSALLASLFGENKGARVEEELNLTEELFLMSTVNLVEVLILLRDKQPTLFEELRQKVFELPIEYVPPTKRQADSAAKARHDHPALNFGDCFAYALAKEEECPVLTLDGDFKKSDIEVLMP